VLALLLIFGVPADPVGWPLIQSFQTELNRMFDRFNSGPFGGDHKVMPVLDIAETEDAVEITAEMPGVKAEDLDVSIAQRNTTLPDVEWRKLHQCLQHDPSHPECAVCIWL